MPVPTVKVTDADPAGTVTLEGTVTTLGLELESDTVAPLVPAAPVRVTVPSPDKPLTIVLGLTETPLRAAAAGLTVTPKVILAPA